MSINIVLYSTEIYLDRYTYTGHAACPVQYDFRARYPGQYIIICFLSIPILFYLNLCVPINMFF